MSKTPDQISTQIRATISKTIPGLSCEIGTPERKIIDACSEAISEAYVDQYLVGSLLDIDTKAGLELEQFVGIFGFGRLNGKAASGTMHVTVNVPGVVDNVFALGTQFYTKGGLAGAVSTLYYTSTQAVVLTAGNLTCDIPVRCTKVGSNGNVPPDSVIYLGNMIGGATVTNLTAMTGGVDVETDQELRQRFKDTLLRNMAGTSDFYEALCQQNNKVSRVVVFGPISLYKTQIEVPSTNLVLASTHPSINQDVKYAWPGMQSVFTNLGQMDETFYSPVDDYTFVGGPSPTFVRKTTGVLNEGDIVDLEFQYATTSSRNDPLNAVTNKVDVFVDGVDPFSVTEKTVVPSDDSGDLNYAVLTDVSSEPLFTENFDRVGSEGSPLAGNRFMRLGSVPIVAFPSSITAAGVVYNRGEHYHVLQGLTLLAGSHQEISGIEFSDAGPPSTTELTLNYVYNRVPELLNAVMAGAKQVTTDVMVHQGTFTYIRPCLQVEYDRNLSVNVVNSAIVKRLQAYFALMPFGAQIKLSNLCMAVQQVLGVIDVKITTLADDSTNYGIQRFKNSALVPVEGEIPPDTEHTTETTDFKLRDNQLAVYQGVLITRVATP